MSVCASTVDFWAFQGARLLDTGAPDPGAASLVVNDDPVSLQMQPQVTTVAAVEQPDGRGRTCARKAATSSVPEYTLTLNICEEEPELWELFRGDDLWTLDGEESAEVIGYADRDPSASQTPGICLEGWEAAWDGNEQKVYDFGSGLVLAFWRTVFPKTVDWHVGDSTMQQGIRLLTMVGTAVTNSQIGNGPLGDWPGIPQGPKARFLSPAPPAAACGVQALAPLPS